MSTSAPAHELAAIKVLKEVSALAAKRTAPDEFTFRRLEREARSSLQQDPSFAYTALGALNAVSGNEELMRKNHTNAISNRDDFDARNNYAISLQYMGFIHEAAEEYRLLVSRDESNLVALQEAISRTWQSGEVIRATELRSKHSKLMHSSNSEDYLNLNIAANLQMKLGITDEQISNLVKIACHYSRQHHISIIGFALETDANDDYETLSLCMLLDMSNKEIWQHNKQVFEIMMDKVPEQSAHLSVRFDRMSYK